ncbi:MAG TPA: hypothetical protein VK666_05840 [Chryseolinea sp.]|nr:hypothetical protein [Chryseolinea sp.]
MKDSLTAFTRKVGYIACVVVVLHVVLALVSLFLPRHVAMHMPLISFYRKMVVLGPYFQAFRLTSSWHLLVSTKQNGSWSSLVDHTDDDFKQYSRQPWRYDLLHSGDYENFAAWEVSVKDQKSIGEVSAQRHFRALNQYVVHELIDGPVDSVMLVYVCHTYRPDHKNYQVDTLFNYRYDPRSIPISKAID